MTFGGAADFAGANFRGGIGKLLFRETRVLVPSAQHAWPEGWRPIRNRRGDYVLGRAKESRSP